MEKVNGEWKVAHDIAVNTLGNEKIDDMVKKIVVDKYPPKKN